jgi:hypothetical protein
MLPLMAGLAIGGVVQGIGALFGANSASKAAEAQIAAAKEAQQKIEGYYAPYYATGTRGLAGLEAGVNSGAYNPNMSNWQQDPGYDFRMSQGLDQINAQAAANGMRYSGATLKALQRYGQNFASNEYNNVYNRRAQEGQFKYGQQANLANIGVNTVGNMSNAIAETIGARGNAQAAGIMGQGNAYQGMFNNLGQMATLGGMLYGQQSQGPYTGGAMTPQAGAQNLFRQNYGTMPWEQPAGSVDMNYNR